MKSYLNLVSRYQNAHKRKTRLIVLSIAISVALITGIFSMLDIFLQFERIQVINDIGNYHMLLNKATESEASAIGSRVDVKSAGRWNVIGSGTIKGISCRLGMLDKAIAANVNASLVEGSFPTRENEIMIEKWASEKLYLDLKINDTVSVTLPDKSKREFVVSGVYNDLSNMKAAGVPSVVLAFEGVNPKLAEESIYDGIYIVEFKKGVKVNEAAKDIKKELNIADGRISLNERLLAVMGQSTHPSATGLYSTGAVLFLIVLIAGVVMIYNTFNISVMERVKHFGLLRCLGASQDQIKKLVKREGLRLLVKALPIGIIAGMLITLLSAAILKYYNKNLFAEIPLFKFSYTGIGAGIVIGFLTVITAVLMPAKKAARVSPVNAVSGNNGIKTGKKMKHSFLTKMFHADLAMGIGNATSKKKTLIMMSCSIAISIILFLGFNVFVDFMHTSIKTSKPYTPDLSLVSEKGLDRTVHDKLAGIDGVSKVYGRMFSYANATFDSSKLTDNYRKLVKDIKVKDDGTFVPPETSWLISYDKNQLKWAKEYLVKGELSEEKLNEQNGIIAVVITTRKGMTSQTTSLELGDKVHVETPEGVKVLTVMAIFRDLPFTDSKASLTTFVTTEKIFNSLAGMSDYKILEIQLKNKSWEQVVDQIKALADKKFSFRDRRQKNAELDQTFLTMAVFIYGFVILIALISVLNIINTMNTSVASKIRYLGVMRAVGMSGSQLDRMVLSEASTYSLVGYIAGCMLGVLLQRALITKLLKTIRINWEFPLEQLVIIFVLVAVVTVISIVSPLGRIKRHGISEVVNSL